VVKPERFSVLVAGAGQLGSRYLQGLVRCLNPLRIFVYDPADGSRHTAAERWSEAGGPSTGHVVSYHDVLDDVSTDLDIVIVATTAAVRPMVVESTAERAQVRMWILEKVLAQSDSDLDRITVAIGKRPGAWVNTWGRMTPWYRQMRSQNGSGPVRFGVEGGSWGLACNAIHFLDLMAWWTDEDLVTIDTRGLDNDWLPGRRPGNLEVSGVLTASYSSGTTGWLSSTPPENEGVAAGSEDPTRMWISGETSQWSVTDPFSSTQGLAVKSDGRELRGRIELQSERTAPLVDGLLDSGTSELTDMETSVNQHRVLLRGLLDRWRMVSGEETDRVPIT
jgi:hypothetical protein